MKLKRILNLLRNGTFFPFVFSRFLTVRRLYSLVKSLGSQPTREGLLSETVFPTVQPKKAVSDLKQDAVAFGFDLSPEDVKEIQAYAKEAPCFRGGLDRDFYFSDVANGRLADGTPVALGRVHQPKKCEAINRIANDPALWEVCSSYLGYTPRANDTRLFWSFASDLNDSERRRLAQTIDFHVDVYSFNFCYAHWYITDTDKDSGAHEMIKGSHIRRKFKWLVGSVNQSRESLAKFYSPEDFLLIEGPAGTGFIEDTSCYHRASPPRKEDRLLLQMRVY